MLLVTCTKVSKDFGGNPVFREIEMEILEGERIGLVGENGSGKSTLFKLLAGLEAPSAGVIARRRNLTIGYLAQEVDPLMQQKTVFEAVAATSDELVTLTEQLKALEMRMADFAIAADEDAMERALEQYSRRALRSAPARGYIAPARAPWRPRQRQ